MSLAIVTATLNPARAAECVSSWIATSREHHLHLYVVQQDAGRAEWERTHHGEQYTSYHYRTRTVLGTVPAFAIGVQRALEDGHEVIACLHDDLLFEETAQGWDTQVVGTFRSNPQIGLLGFGGALGLGDLDLYQKAYAPMQLARTGFGSNMRDAEAHGMRWTLPRRVACLDGFSQVGRREFWEGHVNPLAGITIPADYKAEQLFQIMQEWGVIHHFYDGMLGGFAKRLGWQVWYLPLPVHHFGGRTAVADLRYAEWAADKGGDAGIWQAAHQIGYEQFRDVLPIRV